MAYTKILAHKCEECPYDYTCGMKELVNHKMPCYSSSNAWIFKKIAWDKARGFSIEKTKIDMKKIGEGYRKEREKNRKESKLRREERRRKKANGRLSNIQ